MKLRVLIQPCVKKVVKNHLARYRSTEDFDNDDYRLSKIPAMTYLHQMMVEIRDSDINTNDITKSMKQLVVQTSKFRKWEEAFVGDNLYSVKEIYGPCGIDFKITILGIND